MNQKARTTKAGAAAATCDEVRICDECGTKDIFNAIPGVGWECYCGKLKRPLQQPKRVESKTKWTVEPNGDGTTFNAVFEMSLDGQVIGKGAALSVVPLDEAVAHVCMASRNDAERAAHKKLADPLFQPDNWKLPTMRVTVGSEPHARAIEEALCYFCGGAEVKNIGYDRWEVGSKGYYHYVGA